MRACQARDPGSNPGRGATLLSPCTPPRAGWGTIARVKYEKAPDVCRLVSLLAGLEEFSHIDPSKIHCVKSTGARTRAIARIYGLPGAWIAAGLEPSYVIEVVGEKFYRLPPEERVKVIIHELLHIPRTFSGALRPHNPHVSDARVERLYRLAQKRLGIVERARELWQAND